MFFGEYNHTLDNKGRLTIPAKFRHDFDDGLIVTRGLDGCLFIFTVKAWANYEANVLQQLAIEKKDSRSFLRYIYSGADKLRPDGQGRIILPARLREYAGIETEAVVIGIEERLEVWSPERWQAVLAEVEHDAEQIAEGLVRMQKQAVP